MTRPFVKHVLLAVVAYALASTAVFAAGLIVAFGPTTFAGPASIQPEREHAKAQYIAGGFGPCRTVAGLGQTGCL